jgi:hypothetical protein
LDSVDEGIVSRLVETRWEGVGGLREKGHDRHARVAPNNGNDNTLGEGEVAEDLGNEGRGADDIESGNTE